MSICVSKSLIFALTLCTASVGYSVAIFSEEDGEKKIARYSTPSAHITAEQVDDENIMTILQENLDVVHLHLDNPGDIPEGAAWDFKFPKLKSLALLDMGFNRTEQYGGFTLRGLIETLRTSPYLELLNLNGCRIDLSPEFFKTIAALPLKELDLYKSYVDAEGMAFLKDHPTLEKLTLGGKNVTLPDEIVPHLCFPALKEMTLVTVDQEFLDKNLRTLQANNPTAKIEGWPY